MIQINFSAVNITSDVALWASVDAIKALTELQNQVKKRPESLEKTALELAISNTIARHQNLIDGFDDLLESIGLFQLEPGD